MLEHPLQSVIRDWLPEIDFGVMSHGFAPHGRDYDLVLEVGRSGTYKLTLTHVVEMRLDTRVSDEAWCRSWGDEMINYEAWLAAGEPEGYVWGNNWSMAFPGLSIPAEDPSAELWTKKLGKPMHAMRLETDRFNLIVVFHGVKTTKLSELAPLVEQVLIPLD